MRRHSPLAQDSGGQRSWGALLRRGRLALAVVCMAISFFAFIQLLQIADLSFAVPATAGSLVLETLLAHWVLQEPIDRDRWVGTGLVACGVALLAGHS